MSEATGAADRGHVQHADSRFHTMTCWNWRGLLCMCGFTCCMYALLRLVQTIKTIYSSAFLLTLILQALRDHGACFIISETLIITRYVVWYQKIPLPYMLPLFVTLHPITTPHAAERCWKVQQAADDLRGEIRRFTWNPCRWQDTKQILGDTSGIWDSTKHNGWMKL